MDDWTLKKLQETEFGILCAIDDYCEKHGIHYSLYAGTALGAVRHGGFIPWDDDIDIAMTRTEFDRFCNVWVIDPIEGYHLESILNDYRCGTCHAKLRKNDTILLSEGEIEAEGHHGVWVDIFPLDKVPFNKKVRDKKYKIGKEIIYLTRANVNNTLDTPIKRIARRMPRVFPIKIRAKRLKKLHKWLVEHMEDSIETGYEWKSMSTIYNIENMKFSADLGAGYTLISFNGRNFSIFDSYDSMLIDNFGDYMKLPPLCEQVCKHNPVKVRL